jgi:crotonobetainyl-CoA:carnitine CoA-transferase CaiB-like acyl-CoA transferase
MPAASNDTPLDGVVVVEHCRSVAGSYAGRMLALMGATVIKIEQPGEGDPLRRQPPFLDHGKRSALFDYVNVSKSGVTLDIRSGQGLALLNELLAKADVFLDDTRPVDRTSLGITPEKIAERHPRLLFASLLPFGAYGEHSDYLAYELNTLHSGGEGYLMPNGLALELFPERPPVKIYGQFAQFVGGTSAVCAIISGLLIQDEVGGQFLDVSVQDANVALSCFNIQRLGEGVLENRHGRSFQYGGVLECSDGYVGLLTLEQHQWEGLVTLMGDPEWTKEEWLKDPLARGRRGAEINKGIREWAKTQKVEDLVIKGQAQSVPLAKYVGPDEIMASEQTKARHMFTDIEIPGIGKVPMLAAPFQFTTPETLTAYAATPGADNEAVYSKLLGHGKAEIDRWAAEKVV